MVAYPFSEALSAFKSLKRFVIQISKWSQTDSDGGYGWGGGGLDALYSLRDSTPYRPKGFPLCTILRYPFFADGP